MWTHHSFYCIFSVVIVSWCCIMRSVLLLWNVCVPSPLCARHLRWDPSGTSVTIISCKQTSFTIVPRSQQPKEAIATMSGVTITRLWLLPLLLYPKKCNYINCSGSFHVIAHVVALCFLFKNFGDFWLFMTPIRSLRCSCRFFSLHGLCKLIYAECLFAMT